MKIFSEVEKVALWLVPVTNSSVVLGNRTRMLGLVPREANIYSLIIAYLHLRMNLDKIINVH